MKSFFRTIGALVLFLFLAGCENTLLKEEFINDPPGNFNAFWSEFDRLYGAFEAKHIQWDSLREVYGAGLHPGTSPEELYAALTGLLAELNDGHADLYAPGLGFFRSSSRRYKSYFSDFTSRDPVDIEIILQNIRKYYLGNSLKSRKAGNFLFFSGSILYQGLNIGYLYIPDFSYDSFPFAFIEECAQQLKENDAIILDLRFNGGGSTTPFVRTLNLFCTEKKCFLQSKFRNGPSHSDFTPLYAHYTDPRNIVNRKTIALIVNSFTASSAEHFLLGMKSQPNVFVVGDTTAGAFSAVEERILPNGWQFRLGPQVVYTPEGNLLTDAYGNYLEGIGIAPDYYAPDRKIYVDNKKDFPLQVALRRLAERIAQ